MYFAKQFDIIMKQYNLSAINLAKQIGVSRQRIYDWTNGHESNSTPIQNMKTQNLDALCRVTSLSYSFFEKQDVTIYDFYQCSIQYIINNFSKLDDNVVELIKYNAIQLSDVELMQLPYTIIDEKILEKVWKICLTIYKLYAKDK